MSSFVTPPPPIEAPATLSAWTRKYGGKHRWERVTELPRGIKAPQRVRIYQRCEHYILQWWDVATKRNRSLRVDGDLVTAIARAREIDERLEHCRSSGVGRRRLPHGELVELYLAELRRRTDAGELDPRTVQRYRSALDHYRRFAEQPAVNARYPSATRVDRDFALEFRSYLRHIQVAPNGHPQARKRPLQGTDYILDVARALFRWALDPAQGNLMPAGFLNPFAGRKTTTDAVARDLFGEPDITVSMAEDLLAACDAFQLPLFTTLILYGLRAAEPCYILAEDLSAEWFKVICRPELGYVSKGRRDKRLPLIEPLKGWFLSRTSGAGPLFVRRSVFENREKPVLESLNAAQLQEEFLRRCGRERVASSAATIRIRDAVFRDSGGVTYDEIEGEFGVLARRLGWPRAATLKDFRHLFSTSMENAGMPTFYRRYFMGQSPGRTALVNYTHLNELTSQYTAAVERTLGALRETAARRGQELGFPGGPVRE